MRSMVGLSVILENRKDLSAKRSSQVVSKGSMIKPPSSPRSVLSPTNGFCSNFISGFLDRCFLCNQRLLPGKDIYMYKGDRAFCSVDCRCRQISMDEEETTATANRVCTREYNCSLAATSSSPSSSHSGKGARNRANNNAFAY